MSDRPNVLVIMTDQQKATASHLYGNTFSQTPQMQRLANQGVLFEHAITPHPLCVPARVSFWTSQFPHSHGARRNQTLMPVSATHAFQLWKQAGYHTGLIGKNHCFEHPEDLSLFDTWCEAEGHRKMVRTREWKYVHDPMGDCDELYNLVNDPCELENVADDPAHRDVLVELQLRLADWSILTEDACPVPLPED